MKRYEVTAIFRGKPLKRLIAKNEIEAYAIRRKMDSYVDVSASTVEVDIARAPKREKHKEQLEEFAMFPTKYGSIFFGLR